MTVIGGVILAHQLDGSRRWGSSSQMASQLRTAHFRAAQDS